jgi:HK97 gp10 family phage protein
MKLHGAAELDAKLAALGTDIAGKLGAAALRGASKALRTELIDAAPYNPKGPTLKVFTATGGQVRRTDYGHLRDNLRVKRVKATKPFMIRFQVTTGRAFWGAFLEWGTARMGAKPWARPAFDRMQAKLIEIVLDTLSRGVTRAAKRAARVRRGRIGHNGGPKMED